MSRIDVFQRRRRTGSRGNRANKLASSLRVCIRRAKGCRRQNGRLDGTPPPWSAYHILMACCLVALDKRPGVRPVGIGETLHQALSKLVMRASGDQAKTAYGNLKLCAGLEESIEGETHAAGKRRMKKAR